jgi:signal transduction histidine kinase/DNA-binding response OmpR family regulator
LPDNLNINIPADKRYLRLRYSASTAIENKNITYFYQINEGDWISNESQNELLFPFLASGKHEIRIYAINSQNERSSNTLNVIVHVDNYFYQKWWFISGIVLALLALAVYWFYRIKNENKRLEFTVKERTKELENDKKTIEKQSLELKELDELKNQFFTNLSHELRTPLTLILSPLERLLKGKISKEKSQEYLSLMKDNGEILNDRIAEMLELSLLTARKVELSRDTFYLFEFLDKNTRIFKGLAFEKQIDLVIDIDVNPVQLKSDEKRLGKIIQNLLTNALKFTSANGKVSFQAWLKDDILSMEIKDNGIGIKETDKEKILERFYQVKQNDQAANPGTGIGLTMVKEYVDLLEGTLEIESEFGKGSAFKVKIPVEVIEATEQKLTSKNEALETKLSQKPRLVLVEDNHQLRAYLKDILESDYFISDFENGVLAWQFLKTNQKVDGILSDIMMPEMDGMQLLEEVRADAQLRILPFVFLTSKHNETDKLKSFKMGLDDYLTKPFEEEQLKKRLRTVIDRYNTRLEASLEPDEEELISLGDFAHQLENLIYQNLDNVTFSTTFLAENFKLSRRQFIRVVKKEIGLSPMAYIQEIRLNKARSIIENGNYESLKKVAENVGLKETRYFKKLYFERFGITLN